MDFNNLHYVEEPVAMPVKHPVTGEQTDAVLYVVGLHDAEAQKEQRKIQKALVAKVKSGAELDDLDLRSVQLVAKCVRGWQGIELDGKPVEFSEAEALKWLTKYPWLKDQVERFVGDQTNFFPKL